MSNDRVERLEERMAWLERHLTAQDKAILELHEDVDRLRAAMAALRTRSEQADRDPTERPDADERPPHY